MMQSSFGLFLNETNSRLMMLLYICFIIIFLPQLSFADVAKSFSIETESNDQKIIQGISYHDGTILLRLINRERDPTDCKTQNLTFTIIEKTWILDYTGEPFLDFVNSNRNSTDDSIIDKINFCSNSIENFLPTSGSPSPYGFGCKFPPYGFGCKVTCDNSENQPPACNNLPKCSETQQVLGCDGETLNCVKYPTSPKCVEIAVTKANLTGEPLDCAKYPGANVCNIDCSNIPYLPGCDDCNNNKDALGCDVCNKDSLNPRCKSGYCDNYPDAPECGLINMDKVKIHAVDDKNGNKFILATYYCYDFATDFDCGRLFDMEGVQIKNYNFVIVCGGKFFKYLKYLSDIDELEFLCYNFENDILQLTINEKPILSLNTSNFNSNLLSVFVTEDGGYGIVNRSDATIFVTLLQNNKTFKNYFQIHLRNYEIIEITRIYVCNIAYQSSGYSCVIQTTESGQLTTYYEVDFLSNGIYNTTKINLPLRVNDGITDVQPLNFGGYVIKTIHRIYGNVTFYFINNNGEVKEVINFKTLDIYTSFVTSDNIIVFIPYESSIFDFSYKKLSIYVNYHFKNISLVEGGETFPGGPGGYGSSKILSTTPLKNSTNLRDDILSKEFTIKYNTSISPSTGNFSVYQVIYDFPDFPSYVTLKQTIPAKNDQFVTFYDDTVKLQILNTTISKFNAIYFITVDDDFVKETNGQNVIGIRKNIWRFNVTFASDNFLNESESAIIRLTIKGTKYYTNLTSVHKNEFVFSMESQLRKAISCTGCLNITKYFQYDAHTSYNAKFNSTAYNAQILMRVDINATDERSSNQLLKDLNDTIVYKEINSLVFGNTTYLDASYGAHRTKNLWKEYWGFLLAACILFAILTLLVIIKLIRMTRDKRDPHQIQEERNLLSIFLFVLILIDLALDITFISNHGRDYIWIFPAT
ncbi:hypothetical protein GLOIN_2v1473473 [Rhizophagus irregularis DAOM 181602=DAOM 197198]|nr:hypothetical protein GLOIN_2v1473473 [Rhizophagus irregularis DAOM 181602=DAOM 197198]POG77904.1 hypothetical protein GLOIN_2v1473473 [Rhizophagus irregularis DAOM 181602=DAOM 197198]|eukprot:XP_025184770.1 hypothetical protein GLOIN_2v1473473 [Rhizophagus irregularis DAOM 181602=DAOM 197198]